MALLRNYLNWASPKEKKETKRRMDCVVTNFNYLIKWEALQGLRFWSSVSNLAQHLPKEINSVVCFASPVGPVTLNRKPLNPKAPKVLNPKPRTPLP